MGSTVSSATYRCCSLHCRRPGWYTWGLSKRGVEFPMTPFTCAPSFRKCQLGMDKLPRSGCEGLDLRSACASGSRNSNASPVVSVAGRYAHSFPSEGLLEGMAETGVEAEGDDTLDSEKRGERVLRPSAVKFVGGQLTHVAGRWFLGGWSEPFSREVSAPSLGMLCLGAPSFTTAPFFVVPSLDVPSFRVISFAGAPSWDVPPCASAPLQPV
mmetsp:Transcript_45503/g.114512  ORF Transcript_45503/g.114512 Transcript_45503/m.114512 type:complete len:212 (-) Transcript_45503:4-639(-)